MTITDGNVKVWKLLLLAPQMQNLFFHHQADNLFIEQINGDPDNPAEFGVVIYTNMDATAPTLMTMLQPSVVELLDADYVLTEEFSTDDEAPMQQAQPLSSDNEDWGYNRWSDEFELQHGAQPLDEGSGWNDALSEQQDPNFRAAMRGAAKELEDEEMDW